MLSLLFSSVFFLSRTVSRDKRSVTFDLGLKRFILYLEEKRHTGKMLNN